VGILIIVVDGLLAIANGVGDASVKGLGDGITQFFAVAVSLQNHFLAGFALVFLGGVGQVLIAIEKNTRVPK